MDALLKIGVTKETVKEARAAINDIINARIDNATMQAALTALTSVCSVDHTTISGCTFTTNPPPSKKKTAGVSTK